MSSLWKRVAVRQATVAHLRSRGTFRSECNFRPSLLVVQTHSTYSKRTGKIQCKSPKVKGLAVQVHVFSQAQALWLWGKSIFSNTRHNSSKLNLTKICLMRQRFFWQQVDWDHQKSGIFLAWHHPFQNSCGLLFTLWDSKAYGRLSPRSWSTSMRSSVFSKLGLSIILISMV